MLQMFPIHIFKYIFCSLLNKKDLINLSATSSTIRLLIIPWIFTNIKVTWDQLVNHYVDKSINIFSEIPLHPHYKLSQFNPHAKDIHEKRHSGSYSVRITDASLKYEWSFPFHLLKEVKCLTMNTSKSTNFFKYFLQDNSMLQTLNLSYVKGEGAGNCNAAPVFSLEHLNKFKALRNLVLQNYSIEYFEPMNSPVSNTIDAKKIEAEGDDPCSLPHLTTLKLINCSWEYPFDLLNFDCGSLKEITIVYTLDHFMLFSERFKSLVRNNSKERQDFNFQMHENKSNIVMKLFRPYPQLVY